MSDPQAWSDANLDRMRAVGDPTADAVIDELFTGGGGVAFAANHLLRDLVDNDDVPAAALPPAARAFFLDDRLDPSADPAAIADASALFHRHGALIVLALHSVALPFCYAGRRGVQVLARTGRLGSDARRRVVETAQFVLDVMSPGGLAHDPARVGRGIRSAQKVRLMHATIRRHLRRDPTWDPAWGTPINQEDLAGTLLSFSTITLRALERLGVDLSAREVAAYVHTWGLIGRLLGIDEALIVDRIDDGDRLAAAIARRQHEPCPEGHAMAQALVDYVDYTVPGSALDGALALLIHEHSGPVIAGHLGLARPHLDGRWLPLVGELIGLGDALGDRSRALAGLAECVGRLLLQGLLLTYRGPHRAPFRVPLGLRSEPAGG